jgi:hypothetical protein
MGYGADYGLVPIHAPKVGRVSSWVAAVAAIVWLGAPERRREKMLCRSRGLCTMFAAPPVKRFGT